jgi:WD40 repeat protein
VRVALHSIAKSIAVTSDRVAVATASGPIAMFTLAGAPLAPIAGHAGGTETVAFDPSGALLASGGQDRQIRVWRRGHASTAGAGDAGETFVAAAALEGPKGDTHYVTFADGWLVAAGNDGAVQAWRVTGTGNAIDAASHRVIATHVGAITALATAPGWIASGGRDLAVTRWQTGDAASPAAITQLAAAANALAIAGDGAVHAVTRTGEEIRWDAGPAKPFVEVDRGVADITRIDDAHFAEALTDGAIVIAGQKIGTLDDLQRAVARATTVDLAKLGRTAK